MNEKNQTIEKALEKFTHLDQAGKEFMLGYLTGKHDEKQAGK